MEHFTNTWNLVQNHVELKTEERSINGPSDEMFSAFQHCVVSFREKISLLGLSLEHVRQNTDWMVMVPWFRD